MRRPRLRLHPRQPREGIRAATPNELWHIDTTVIRLLDGSKAFVQAVNRRHVPSGAVMLLRHACCLGQYKMVWNRPRLGMPGLDRGYPYRDDSIPGDGLGRPVDSFGRWP